MNKDTKVMIYEVNAKLKAGMEAEYLTELTNGTIRSQQPDGQEIFDAMLGAIMQDDNSVLFNMECFCSIPLAHECETVFDKYFENMNIQLVSVSKTYNGQSFMEHLSALS